MTRIAVAGGTGLVGRLVVRAIRDNGDSPLVLARSTGVDLTTGRGVDAALAGIGVVIDVTNVVTTSRRTSIAFFESATRTLLAAGQRVGVTHHVVLSIVGVDRVAWGYYFGKRRQEDLALTGPVPGTVLRVTQFHEFAEQVVARSGPVVVVPRMLSQPIAAREVATALADLARRAPRGLAPELAGPQREHLPDMVRRLLRARSSRRPVLTVPIPGSAGRALATGALLPKEEGPRGRQTYAQWLTDAGSGATSDGRSGAPR